MSKKIAAEKIFPNIDMWGMWGVIAGNVSIVGIISQRLEYLIYIEKVF